MVQSNGAYKGSTHIDTIYKGSSRINKIYKGSTLIYQRGVLTEFSQIFTTSGNITFPDSAFDIEVRVVGGGGAAGYGAREGTKSYSGGAGGSGGMALSDFGASLKNTTCSFVVGAGGISAYVGNPGGNSSFTSSQGTMYGNGGGGGGYSRSSPVGGSGGTASGGNVSNTSGNAGAYGGPGTGVRPSGGASLWNGYGKGGDGYAGGVGQAGTAGCVYIYYKYYA